MTRKPGKHGGKWAHKETSPSQSKEVATRFAQHKIYEWHSTLPVILQLHYDTPKVVNHKQNYDHIAEYLYTQLALHNSKQLQPPPGDFSIAHPSPPIGEPKYLVICLRSWYPPQHDTSRKIMKALDECYEAGVSPQTKKDGQNPDFHSNHFGILATPNLYLQVQIQCFIKLKQSKHQPTLKRLNPETFVRMLGINHKLSQASANNSGPHKHKDLTEHGRFLSIGFNSMVAVSEGSAANWH
ncbi:hypothetical protein BCR39DRAFT_508323 [Naematelia encephala]|uniref:Uncharacterized protein n=1 Tax=Naematelia encephala TaxID=71784 RepID=A0A1Y2AGA4_9TREE|nr:hypothetical protein BCR39DRAFT_508323 [Naematelia encephala]